MKRPQGIRRPSIREAALLVQALGAILRVRMHLVRGKHHALRRLIEAHSLPDKLVLTQAPRADMAEIAWSVRNAARLVPGATCLTQASAGQLLLARRGYASTIRLSVPHQADTVGKLAPHAWLIAGETIVLGGTATDYARHRPLHDFTLPAPSTAHAPTT
ncbi:MAG: lasso peptide biosynthesis B2 protein [Paracoccus sp. (in: a-proteobacteria)]|uniref:lasso peptide biosynthesis B2 protein n=1 Tax=Paracoccus sp. TaxID=267 RepID=UPI0032427943